MDGRSNRKNKDAFSNSTAVNSADLFHIFLFICLFLLQFTPLTTLVQLLITEVITTSNNDTVCNTTQTT